MTTTSDTPREWGDGHILPYRPNRQTLRSQSDQMAGAQPLLESRLVPEPRVGRVYRSHRTIRLADVAVDGRLRLDAMARYMQDVASDDVVDAGAEDALLTWVVRRTIIDVEQQFGVDRSVSLATWASGSGSHWAARRTSIAGDAGGHAEAESIWVLLDRVTSRPARLPAAFDALYGASGLGRKVSAKLELPPEPAAAAMRVRWPIRVSDLDTLGHANNAVYWAATESALATEGDGGEMGERVRAVLEYRRPLDLTSDLELAIARERSETAVWFIDGGDTAACAVIRRLD
jgi:acyl-ACP thioesterase